MPSLPTNNPVAAKKSLPPRVREEAEIMLNAVVEVREKHFGEL